MEDNRGLAPHEQPQILSYHAIPPSMTRGPRRIGFLALCATVLLPGLGHLAAGDRKRGVVWFATFASFLAATMIAGGMPGTVPALIVLFPLNAISQLWMLVDAFRSGRRANAPLLGKPWINFPAGAVLILLASLLSPVLPIVTLYKTHVTEAFVIPTAGMSPTIAARDRVIVHKHRLPKRWDIIAFDSPQLPGSTFLQRLVGLPGETVEIKDGTVHINGNPISRPPQIGPYLAAPQREVHIAAPGHPITLGPDDYFVLGDNSSISLDSRYWSNAAPGHQLGAVPRSSVVGVATWIYWPIGHWKKLY